MPPIKVDDTKRVDEDICQFGSSGRSTIRGPQFADSDIYITKTFKLQDGKTFHFNTQMSNALNHANFAPPSNLEAECQAP